MKRCFVALRLPEPTRVALVEAEAELKRLGRAAADRLRPVVGGNLHVTIEFLGDTPDDQIASLGEALRAVAARHPRPAAVLAGVGAFPSPARPRIVFAALGQGAERVAALTADVETACATLGFPREERESRPHVTIARVEGARPRGPLSEWIAAQASRTFGPIDDAALVLFESQLQPGGSLYTPLAVVPFGSP